MTPANPFRPKTLAEEVASYVRKELLLSDTYPAGSFIREEELASKLGISRAPVREGLKILEGLGLLRSIPQKGSLVVTFSSSEIEELYDIRFALEEILFREIIRRGTFTGERQGALKKILSRMGLLGSSGDSREEILLEFSRLDMEFHLSLAALAGREWTLRLLKTVYHQIQHALLRDLATESDMDALVAEHEEILLALQRGDLEELRKGRFFSYFERRLDPNKGKVRPELSEIPGREDETRQKKGEDVL
ncbi:MAG: GntR family transcriptional regulator [Aminivibrio sp.]|jgi:Transcriptional regulators|nr:GntR family transcriptional regulator [Aminivibrio sp.]